VPLKPLPVAPAPPAVPAGGAPAAASWSTAPASERPVLPYLGSPALELERPAGAPRARIPLAEPIPVVRRPGGATGAGTEGNAPPGLPADVSAVPEPPAALAPLDAPPRGRPQLEIVRLDSVAHDPMASEEMHTEPASAPARSARRIVVPIELDLENAEAGECIELVLRLDIGRTRTRRQVSG